MVELSLCFSQFYLNFVRIVLNLEVKRLWTLLLAFIQFSSKVYKINKRVNQPYLKKYNRGQYYIKVILIEEIEAFMGCTSNFEMLNQHASSNKKSKSTIQIEILGLIDDQRTFVTNSHVKTEEKTLPEEKDLINQQETNQKIKQRQQKIRYLQGSKNFMEISIEASSCVNHALVTLFKNPLLKDQSFPKLIGLNKKVLSQKQNRFSYLANRQRKMEIQIKKQREKCLERYKSQYLGKRNFLPKQEKKIKQANKENRKFLSLFFTLNKDSHNQKTEKLDKIISCSQKSLQ